MQKYKSQFKDKELTNHTVCNIQSCFRTNDLDLIDDGTHLLFFRMMGMFSFRGLTLEYTVNFWLEFIKEIGLELDYVTIHPDKPEWRKLYSTNIKVKFDEDCIWSDGELGGYCTEFYVNGIEIGNIVNTEGDCIDVGFGFERIVQLLYGGKRTTERDVLESSIRQLDLDGFRPSGTKQGYVLRKLLRKSVLEKYEIDHPLYHLELDRQKKMKDRYKKLIVKHSNKPKEWWFDTHGIDIDLIELDI